MQTIKDFNIGQKVKVNEQNIIGKIILINYDQITKTKYH
jgi:hypothetical protein